MRVQWEYVLGTKLTGIYRGSGIFPQSLWGVSFPPKNLGRLPRLVVIEIPNVSIVCYPLYSIFNHTCEIMQKLYVQTH